MDLLEEIEKSRAHHKAKTMVKALMFYADDTHYVRQLCVGQKIGSLIELDRGKLAREALEVVKGDK
jgi:hypothetical protein|tara:strand:- start:1116 stop:1313 length:198 start_codon:yes stop_codon:yes gene_type:complete